MIIKSTSQAGQGLAAHLLNDEDGNEQVTVMGGRHIIDSDVFDNLNGWLIESRGTRLQKPLQHVAIAPDHKLSQEEWEKVWSDYENEFGLEDVPYIEVEHLKKGKPHRHRVYRRFGDDGKAIDMGRSRMRQEKLARCLEIDLGHQLQQGKHSRAVMSVLIAEGRDDVARVIASHGHDTAPPPIPSRTGSEWQQEARGVSIEGARKALLEAWQSSDTPESFRAAVRDAGLTLARGTKAVVAVDAAGDTHPVMRALNATKEVRLRKRDLDGRLAGLEIPDAADVIQQQRDAQRDAALDAPAAAADSEPTTGDTPEPEADTEPEPTTATDDAAALTPPTRDQVAAEAAEAEQITATGGVAVDEDAQDAETEAANESEAEQAPEPEADPVPELESPPLPGLGRLQGDSLADRIRAAADPATGADYTDEPDPLGEDDPPGLGETRRKGKSDDLGM